MMLHESSKKEKKKMNSTLVGTKTISFAFPKDCDLKVFLDINNLLSKL